MLIRAVKIKIIKRNKKPFSSDTLDLGFLYSTVSVKFVPCLCGGRLLHQDSWLPARRLDDRIRVRAVCKLWRSSISVSDPSPRLPWFLRFAGDGEEEIICYSLSSNKTYKIHCQQLRDAYFEGTAGSFILCCRDGRPEPVSLFNPFNGLEISLPSPNHFQVYGVVSNPLQEDILAVSGTEARTGDIWSGFIRPGEETWVIRRWDIEYHFGVCVYYGGLWYVNEHNAHTLIEDAATGNIVSVILSPDSDLVLSQHMLETCGEILIIFRCNATDKLEGTYFDIYRLDEVRGNYQWVKIGDIGDRMLFLNRIGGFSLRNNELPGFKGNSIYFMDHDLQSNSILLCQHDLKNGTTEALPNFWGEGGTWIIPSFG
ncbi:F-box domain-containing protein [Rhynchospora pubera]|uniref:F-box domain-containing protein n=1 Tax=Rhynchospora pubera TaxID=906938 RepID=A0AAV8G2A4_9POAL|nr:F-box domain-containing protein [Rhynchospora pubera]KAJ4799849.1 F-box domain-containing protein [Rhynchospora pubera]